jgi:hypothetical protein
MSSSWSLETLLASAHASDKDTVKDQEGTLQDFSDLAKVATALDASDSLRSFRDEFNLPVDEKEQTCVYLCGNSLGLQVTLFATAVRALMLGLRLFVSSSYCSAFSFQSYTSQFYIPAPATCLFFLVLLPLNPVPSAFASLFLQLQFSF